MACSVHDQWYVPAKKWLVFQHLNYFLIGSCGKPVGIYFLHPINQDNDNINLFEMKYNQFLDLDFCQAQQAL